MLLPVNEAEKVFVDIPSEVASERDKFDYTYESDIDFPLRFIIDRKLKNSMFEVKKGEVVPTDQVLNIPPRVWTLDIEVLYSDIVDPYVAFSPIVCITVHDSYTDKETCYSGGERRILLNLLDTMIDEDPDVIAGWNISYDVISIIRRMQKLKMEWRSISPIGIVQCTRKKVKIHGRQLIDLQTVYVKFKHKKFTSENLTYIARVEEKITDAPLETDYKYFSEHLDEFLELNRSHVRYCVEINNRYNLIGLREAMRSFTCGRYNETEYIGRTLDLLLLRRYHGRFVARRKPPSDTKREKYKGAFVLQPERGMFKNVIVLDYAGMYPNIIISFNMSPETLTDKSSPWGTFEVNGTYFKRSPEGELPKLIKELQSMRAEVREQMRKSSSDWRDLYAMQYSYKQVIASTYGTFASPYFRFYAPQISAAITFIGRRIIQKTISLVQEKGYKVIESDTDSTLVALNDVEDPIEVATELNDYINVKMKTIAKEEGTIPMHIKFEKVYSDFIATDKKKRYAGIVTWDEGHKTSRLEVKGLEYKRSNSPQITKEIQEKILMMLLEGRREEVHKYLLRIEDEIREYPLEKLAIPMKLQRHFEDYADNYQAALRGMKWCEQELGMHFDLFERFYMVYIKKPYPRIKLKRGIYKVDRVAFNSKNPLPEYLKEKIDYKMVVDKIINKKVKKILEAVGMLVDARQTQIEGWCA